MTATAEGHTGGKPGVLTASGRPRVEEGLRVRVPGADSVENGRCVLATPRPFLWKGVVRKREVRLEGLDEDIFDFALWINLGDGRNGIEEGPVIMINNHNN